MSPALLALLALVATLVLSMTTRVNVGLVAIALTWVIGVHAARLRPDALVTGFPSALFITLAGVTLLFAVAKANGTLDLLARRAAALVSARVGLLPPLFFALAFALSAVGPGAIASVALVAPLAMPTGSRAGVPNLLTAIMVGTGANAGNLSPISTTGALVATMMSRLGLGGNGWRIFAAMFVAHVAVAAAAYLLFGGLRLVRERARAGVEPDPVAPLARGQWITIAVTALWIAAVVVAHVHVGLAAFAAATLLVVLRVVDEREAIRGIPLDVILMVCGVSMLIALLETTGGLALFTRLLARIATPATLTGVIAFVTGIISTYSSTMGVVLPTFIPMVPSLVREVGGGDPVAVSIAATVGASLVDVSPLSTLGALCVAAVHQREAARRLFGQLMIWGLSMSVVGALFCQAFASLFARM
jgi:di/tricarboxylate transporter